jgi:uncharacterized damage-inducible protein DinB
MSEVTRIVDQMRRGWDGDAWHGTPLWTILRDITASEANARPIPGGHTIAEIVQHLAYWKEATISRIAGNLVSPAHDEQWPPHPDASEAAWHEALKILETWHQALMIVVEKLNDEELAQPIAGRDYDVYVQLHGTLQHDLYHAGQIALLKRAVRA